MRTSHLIKVRPWEKVNTQSQFNFSSNEKSLPLPFEKKRVERVALASILWRVKIFTAYWSVLSNDEEVVENDAETLISWSTIGKTRAAPPLTCIFLSQIFIRANREQVASLRVDFRIVTRLSSNERNSWQTGMEGRGKRSCASRRSIQMKSISQI